MSSGHVETRAWLCGLIGAAAVALGLLTGLAFAQTAQRHGDVRFVSATSLNVRSGPGPDQSIVGHVPYGAQVTVQSSDGDWTLISMGRVSGWVASRYLTAAPPPPPHLSSARVRQLIIAESLRSYGGSCPCPYNVDRAGRRCGGRSAYSRPGGASPVCYASDVSDADVEHYLARRNR